NEKQSRTPAQRKLATVLVYDVRALAGDKAMRDVPRLLTSYVRDKAARVEVDLRANVTAELLDAIRAEGGEVVSSYPQYHAVRAYLPLSSLERLAERGDVLHVKPAARPVAWGFDEKKVNTSQGDVAHRANLARSTFGVDGTGVKVGVLSDSVEKLATLQASGD